MPTLNSVLGPFEEMAADYYYSLTGKSVEYASFFCSSSSPSLSESD